MRKFALPVAWIVMMLGGCTTPAANLGETKVPLELKGYRLGMALEQCPLADPAATIRQGRVLSCVLNEASLGGAVVKNAGAVALDGRVVFVNFDLVQSGGFSQPAVLRALIEKFGPPARGAQPRVHIWKNGDGQLQLEEIPGKVTMIDTKGFSALHASQGKDGANDL